MRKRGSITIFLALLLTVTAGFIITLDTYAGGFMSKCEVALAADNAVRSCFAEYNRELFERYHILLIDSSYKSMDNGRDRIGEHFSSYLENSVSAARVCDTGIEEWGTASDDDGKYMFAQAVRFAREEIMENDTSYDDEDCFRAYLLKVFGNRMDPSEGAVREGELEYLIYGYEADTDNILQALYDHEESGEGSYDEFLHRRIGSEETSVLKRRFTDLVTEYMRENGSPGFDLSECCHSITFRAGFEDGEGTGFCVLRTYAYDT